MTENPLEVIKNARFWLEHIAGSGQPSAEQFTLIRDAGYVCVINLALPTSTNALVDECEIVTGLGMNYIHIPVEWQKPEIEQLRAFFDVIERLEGQEIWVHCALNYRVSIFLFLYRVIKLGSSQSATWEDVLDIWEPDEVWCGFIRDCLASFDLDNEIEDVC